MSIQKLSSLLRNKGKGEGREKATEVNFAVVKPLGNANMLEKINEKNMEEQESPVNKYDVPKPIQASNLSDAENGAGNLESIYVNEKDGVHNQHDQNETSGDQIVSDVSWSRSPLRPVSSSGVNEQNKINEAEYTSVEVEETGEEITYENSRTEVLKEKTDIDKEGDEEVEEGAEEENEDEDVVHEKLESPDEWGVQPRKSIVST